MEVTTKTRLHLLDALRGFLMIHMIAFHGMWNLVYLFGVRAPWYRSAAGYIWQQFICWSFILLSGFCWSMSHNHLKRGLLVFGGGAVVSLVTCLLMPESRILFGVLTCIGSCMLLMIPLASVLYALMREFTQKRLASRGIPAEKLLDQPPELKSGFKERHERSKKNGFLSKLKPKKKG